MRTFFLQLFICFWLATILIFVGGSQVTPADSLPPHELDVVMVGTVADVANLTLRSYTEHGCTSAAVTDPRWVLLDAAGRALCNRPLSTAEREVARKAVAQGTARGERIGDEWLHAIPVTMENGSRWFLVTRNPYHTKIWWTSFLRLALPLSILVTFLFAYLLTRPIRALSLAFRRFTAGELDTRLPVTSRSRWTGLNSADVQTLMSDFNRMADQVTELIDAQKMLVRDVSHELRSPLARLRVALELARENSHVDDSLFDQMEHETERVNELIGEMLTLSLLESTGKPPRHDRFDMIELVSGVVESANFEASARGCVVQWAALPVSSVLTGQPEMIARAVENILRNAIRYTPQGGQIEVELQAASEEQSRTAGVATPAIALSVRDTGPGIPVDHLSHIFRPFYRVDMARSESSGGFGVGLAIAERAIHLHGGRILASNRSSGGLDVQIILPVRP